MEAVRSVRDEPRASSSKAAGDLNLAFEINEDDMDRRRRPQSEPDDMDSTANPVRKKAGASGVGNALREAYQEALREDVPPDLLDLLGKLG
jgi:hypothetical protein